MTTPATVKDERIPSALSRNSILSDFCSRYLAVVDEIASYNKEVLASKDSEWNGPKVIEKARELGRPTDANVKANDGIASALDEWERLITQTAHARKAVLDLTSKELGITLSATQDRNPELEAPMKERRKLADEIGKQLGNIAKMTTDEKASDAVEKFLEANGLPAIGRDQVKSFGENEKATPKYRVNVTVSKDGTELLSESGFTKTALKLTQAVFGYERGKAPKQDDLRKAWEAAGNTPETTTVNPVEFDDNQLHFVITKK